MAGRHSVATRRQERALEIVDVHNVTHLLTPEALGAGRRASTGYVAVCGDTVTRAPMAEPGSGRYCPGWRAIPAQRSAAG